MSAFSCDGDFSGVGVEKGGWGYHPIICLIKNNESIKAANYAGDLSDKIDVTVSEEDLHEYRISLIVDATDVDNGDYGGKVNLYDDNGSKFAEFDVKLQVGEGEIEEISLSENRIRFLLEDEDSEECYKVKIKNTGNVDLRNLEADVKSWDDNCMWIEINEIDDEDFRVGEEETLEICVNNRDNCTGWDERRTEIRIETREVGERVEVRLITDREGHWEVDYHELNDKHDFLWKTYLREHNYMVAWELLNRTHDSLVDNYTMLEGNYTNLSVRYDELRMDYDLVRNYSRELNESYGSEVAVLEEEIRKAGDAVEELNEQLGEKDVFLVLLQRKYENLSKSKNETGGEVIGGMLSVVGNQSTTAQHIGVALVFLMVAAGVAGAFVVYRNKRAASVETGSQQGVDSEDVTSTGSSLFGKHQGATRDVQKEKVRTLLMEKLAEKSSNENV